MNEATVSVRGRSRPMTALCYHCSSTDTMEPFRREPAVFLLSRILRALQWRYCRRCTRHFLHWAR